MTNDEGGTPPYSLLARYLSGECDVAESASVKRWIAADPSHKTEIDRLASMWKAESPAEFDADGTVWGRISQGMSAPATRPDLSVESNLKTRRPASRDQRFTAHSRSSWLMRAAAAVLVIGGGALLRYGLPPQLRGRSDSSARIPMREIATRPGQRVELQLEDGTHVVLGPASQLRYASRFGDSRDVELTGEAYFEVAHDPSRPFAVHTARGVARDIGTTFGVVSYSDSRAMEVVVEDGSVAVASAVLSRGDLASVSDAGVLTVKRGVDVDAYLAWASGRLVFQNTPLRDAIAQFNRWYDADLRIGDSAMADYPVTATFSTESLSQAVTVIASALDAHVERDATTTTLYPRRHVR